MIGAGQPELAARFRVRAGSVADRGEYHGRRGPFTARVPIVDLVPLFLVLVTFAAAQAGLQRARPELPADGAARSEIRIDRVPPGADLDEAIAALGRFARVTSRPENADETLLLDIEPTLVFEPGAPTVRREALVLLFRLAQTLRNSSNDLRLTVIVSVDDLMAPKRVSTVVGELHRLGVTDERLTMGFSSVGSRPGLQLRLDGDLVP